MAAPRSDRMEASPFVPSDSAVIEVFVPTGDFAQVTIDHVLHAYRDFLKMVLMEEQEKVFGPSSSQPCENNANCFPDFLNERRAVTLYTAGGGLCTGALINNVPADTRLYLTASHCLQDNVNSNSGFISPGKLTFATFYFNAETFSCGTNNGPSSFNIQQLSGSVLLDNTPFNQGVDFAILRLNSVPPASFNPYYLGWDASSFASGSTVGIHHPG